MSPDGPTPAQLLAAAEKTLTQPADWGSAWAQAVAFLTRQALEDALDVLWADTVALQECSMSDQLTCLPTYLDDDALARQVSQTWHALSNACHAHPYELDPTEGELRGWVGEVKQLVAALQSPKFPVPG